MSRAQCQIADPYPETFASTIQITAADGTTVWDPGSSVFGISAIPMPKVLPPGGSYLWTTAQWDQKTCTAPACKTGPASSEGPQVPPGKYTAAPASGLTPPSPPAPVTFMITA